MKCVMQLMPAGLVVDYDKMPALQVLPGRCQPGGFQDELNFFLLNWSVKIPANTASVFENLKNVHVPISRISYMLRRY